MRMGARTAEDGVRVRASRGLAAEPPGWPTRDAATRAPQAPSSSKVTDFPLPRWDATFFLLLDAPLPPLSPLPMETTAVAAAGPTGTASSLPVAAPPRSAYVADAQSMRDRR